MGRRNNVSEKAVVVESQSMQMLTAEDLADMLRVSKKTLQRWRASGRGPRFILLPSGLLRYRSSDVQQWQQRVIQEVKPRYL